MLEKKLAAFYGKEHAIAFSSGFDANSGLIECLFTNETMVIYDEHSHYSIKNGLKLSKC